MGFETKNSGDAVVAQIPLSVRSVGDLGRLACGSSQSPGWSCWSLPRELPVRSASVHATGSEPKCCHLPEQVSKASLREVPCYLFPWLNPALRTRPGPPTPSRHRSPIPSLLDDSYHVGIIGAIGIGEEEDRLAGDRLELLLAPTDLLHQLALGHLPQIRMRQRMILQLMASLNQRAELRVG